MRADVTTAVIPTRNEAQTIAPLVFGLHNDGIHSIVVDDSQDQTYIKASAAGATCLHVNEDGLGPAYKLAWTCIDFDDYALHVDAGGSHDRESIRRVADSAQTADVVVGSRFREGSEYLGNPKRKYASMAAAFACNLTVPFMSQHTDWTSGLRTYSPAARALLSAHNFRTTGHAWQIEALWVCERHNLNIKEVPITYQAGVSHLSRARTREAFDHWKLMWRTRW